MTESRATRGAREADPDHVRDRSRAGTPGKRSGVPPIAIAGSVLVCAAAFAYVMLSADSLPPEGAAATIVAEADTGPAATAETKPAERIRPEAAAPEPPARTAPAERRPDPLSADDPRWSRDAGPATPDARIEWDGEVAIADSEAEIVALEEKLRAGGRLASANPLIAPRGQTPEFAYAGPDGAEAEPAGASAGPDEPSFGPIAMVDARTTDFVNMRAKGSSRAPVIAVVPDGAAVRIAAGCKGWCATIHEGRRGYVYRDYLDVIDSRSTASVPAARPAPERKSKLPRWLGGGKEIQTPNEDWQTGR